MSAAVVHAFDRLVTAEDVQVAKPGPEQVPARIETCGACQAIGTAVSPEDLHRPRKTRVERPEVPPEDVADAIEAALRIGASETPGTGDRALASA